MMPALPAPEEDHLPIAVGALELLAKFAQVQDAMGWVIRGWADDKKFPNRVPKIERADLRALRDEDCLTWFLQAAEDIGTELNAPNVATAFNRLKSTRDMLAHAISVIFGREDNGTPFMGSSYYHGDRKPKAQDGQNSKLTLEKLRKRMIDGNWLLEVAEFTRQTAGFQGGVIQVSRKLPRPPLAPERR